MDSLHVEADRADSLMRYDSLFRARMLEADRKMLASKQVATQREIDLTGDGLPEILRLEGVIDPHFNRTHLTFSIRFGRKILFQDSWPAEGYFDRKDPLSDTEKIWRLRRLVTVFFSNENFSMIDRQEFDRLMKGVSPAEVKPGSPEAKALFAEPKVMYNVWKSRDEWYGLVWDPKKQRFVRVWQN